MNELSEVVARRLAEAEDVRRLVPYWNSGMIAASLGVSLLGAFTSTQLMCQARLSRYLSGVLLWSCLASLTFGFCSIWCLHFVAMLACELDLPIGLNVPLTILSALLAVSFTFVALASDMLWDRYRRTQRRKSASRRHELRRAESGTSEANLELNGAAGTQATSTSTSQNYRDDPESNTHERPEARRAPSSQRMEISKVNGHLGSPAKRSIGNGHTGSPAEYGSPRVDPLLSKTLQEPDTSEALPTLASLQAKDPETAFDYNDPHDSERESIDASSATEPLLSRRSSAVTDSDVSFLGLGNMMSIRTYRRSGQHAKNAFVETAKQLYQGCTLRNAGKGFIWSLAIDSMHYIGILALQIPGGYTRLHPGLVLLSAFISFIVCCVGAILMGQMEIRLSQQMLFSVVATTGVAAMHFTGMAATSFYSTKEPSEIKGYPPQLAAAIGTIAIATCLAANYLLAHSATIARNKLAEIVQTRKKLWAAIAQKENAEAAARARSEFIASASHEIRTPLHQLQGYSDLLSRTDLTEEGRLLLYAIQHATRSLSLITSNVLDWSRLEKGEATCRPVALDIRLVCESIVNLLPNREDDAQAEMLVVVAPSVPQTLFLDETYTQRIVMNLLSNAIKFTSTGYVMLLMEMDGDTLVATVSDTGSGIPESFLPDLFEPFKQAQTRGAQRGTGLGMSIIKQLLEKMQGTIDVSSRHHQANGNNGSTFVIKIPTESAPSTQADGPGTKFRETVFYFPGLCAKTAEGLRIAFSKYKITFTEVKSIQDLPREAKFVWASVPYLKDNPHVTKKLMRRTTTTVLVPMDSPDAFTELPGVAQAPNFLTLQRPLMWHRIVETLEEAARNPSKAHVDKAVRFAPEVNLIDQNGTPSQPQSDPEPESPRRSLTILLVEDNRINQKLGVKMLKTLGYQVITADDGQDAIERIQEHDREVDCILMDQSMPRKDGLTATREIRMMEEDGTLSRRRKIIAVTAVVGPEAQSMCRDAGTDDFLPKPLSLAKLGQSLKHHLQGVQ